MHQESGYHMPAEFETQSAVWFGWPTFQWYSSNPSLDTRIPLGKIIGMLSEQKKVSVLVMCKDASGESSVRDWLTKAGYESPNVRFVHIDQVDIWTRDFGPIFLKNDANQLGMVSFQQNQWGYSTTDDPTSKAMAAVPGLVAEYVGIKQNFPASIVSEGGDRIVNGKGVLFVNRAVEFQRNPEFSQTELEEAFTKTLGVSKIIWFNNGIREDLHTDWGPIPYKDTTGKTILLYGPQTTGGHLDEFVRFASPSKVILAQVNEDDAAVDSIAAVNYARLEEAYRVISAAADQDGNPFEIIRIPVPDIQYMQVNPGQAMYDYLEKLKYPPNVPQFPANKPIYVVKSSSYANYLVTNGLVIAPKYGNNAKDEAVASVLKGAYNRNILQIDPSAINYAGGGFHCCTQQQPSGII